NGRSVKIELPIGNTAHPRPLWYHWPHVHLKKPGALPVALPTRNAQVTIQMFTRNLSGTQSAQRRCQERKEIHAKALRPLRLSAGFAFILVLFPME
ncbi:MAG: hypothetical protein KC425_25965, partial [Anaerolineales bacterium]|nr:hypothetical protein [Anaerolineales bacterium]